MNRICLWVIVFFAMVLFPSLVWAGSLEGRPEDQSAAVEPESSHMGKEATLKMLKSILVLKNDLKQQIARKKQILDASQSETEKAYVSAELVKLDKLLAGADLDFERIATGVDIGLFAEKKAEHFNWKDELVSLVEPGIMELKRLTVKARHKTKLKDEQSFYQDLVPIAEDAFTQINVLISQSRDPVLKKDLQNLLPEWKSVESQIRNKLDLVELQLAEIESKETSLLESSQKSAKVFFKTRGLFLFIALVSCAAVILFFRVSYLAFMKIIPGYKARYRPFHVRVVEMLYRVMVLVMTLFTLVMVFYLFEDWVLLSLTIIFLMGLGWTVKHTLPRFWHQSRLMLNIGGVREGERIHYQGVPWLVKNINVFTTLENPYLGVSLRLPVETFLDKTSRPFNEDEPWFPCKKNDWVILADGTRGCVTSLSHEMVEIVQRGGAKKVYQTSDFLSQSPLNLSVNFRLKIPFGISYDLQAISTNGVLTTLDAHIRSQAAAEGYEPDLLNLRVEFAQAGGSSLDLVIIADFKGELAPLYNRLSRAIQRWCVDACTINSWEIPFPQLTVHRPSIGKETL